VWWGSGPFPTYSGRWVIPTILLINAYQLHPQSLATRAAFKHRRNLWLNLTEIFVLSNLGINNNRYLYFKTHYYITMLAPHQHQVIILCYEAPGFPCLVPPVPRTSWKSWMRRSVHRGAGSWRMTCCMVPLTSKASMISMGSISQGWFQMLGQKLVMRLE